jgi:large subunit ribosomal protein L15
MPKKRVKKYRGSGSCGGGSRKNRRGRGNRGGSGNSGHLKHNYLRTIKSGQLIGKYGFSRPEVVKKEYRYRQNLYRVLRDLRMEGRIDYDLYRYLLSKSELNVGDIEEVLEKLKDTDFVTEEGGTLTLNLSELGFQKLLGNGNISKEINVRISNATEKAIDKIEKAGGKVITVEE